MRDQDLADEGPREVTFVRIGDHMLAQPIPRAVERKAIEKIAAAAAIANGPATQPVRNRVLLKLALGDAVRSVFGSTKEPIG